MPITRDELRARKALLENHPEQDSVEEKIERVIEADKLHKLWKRVYPHDTESNMTRRKFISSVTGYPERSVARYLNLSGLTRDKRDFAHKVEKELKEQFRSKISNLLDLDVKIKGSMLIVRFDELSNLTRLSDVIDEGVRSLDNR